MAFTHEPTTEQVQRFVKAHFAPEDATRILDLLDEVSEDIGDVRGWYQAAVLVHWHDRSPGRVDLLPQHVGTVNSDPRDFLRSFGAGPDPSWESQFIHQSGE